MKKKMKLTFGAVIEAHLRCRGTEDFYRLSAPHMRFCLDEGEAVPAFVAVDRESGDIHTNYDFTAEDILANDWYIERPQERHFMLDIETLSTRENPLVWCVALVEFCPNTGYVGNPRLWYLDRAEQHSLRRHVEPDTVLWTIKSGDAAGYGTWLLCNDSADIATIKDSKPYPITKIARLHAELKDILEPDPMNESHNPIWANGASFDFCHLRTLFKTQDLPTPWLFRNESCMRSFRNRLPNRGYEYAPVVNAGIAHRATDDVRYQAEWLQNMLSGSKPETNPT